MAIQPLLNTFSLLILARSKKDIGFFFLISTFNEFMTQWGRIDSYTTKLRKPKKGVCPSAEAELLIGKAVHIKSPCFNIYYGFHNPNTPASIICFTLPANVFLA